MDNIGWYISRMCLAWTILVGKSTVFLSFMDSNDWFISMFCLSWLVFLPDFSFVDKNWLVYQPILSVVDKNSW